MIKKLSSSIVIYGGTNAIKSLVPFLMLPILTAYISPKEYGELSLIETTILFLLPFVMLNINGAINVEYFRRDNRSEYKQYVINAIIFMSSNEQRIIHPISNGKQDKELSVDKRIYREYILSSRGEAYITNISTWEPYINRVKNNLIDKYTELVYKDNHLD